MKIKLFTILLVLISTTINAQNSESSVLKGTGVFTDSAVENHDLYKVELEDINGKMSLDVRKYEGLSAGFPDIYQLASIYDGATAKVSVNKKDLKQIWGHFNLVGSRLVFNKKYSKMIRDILKEKKELIITVYTQDSQFFYISFK